MKEEDVVENGIISYVDFHSRKPAKNYDRQEEVYQLKGTHATTPPRHYATSISKPEIEGTLSPSISPHTCLGPTDANSSDLPWP